MVQCFKILEKKAAALRSFGQPRGYVVNVVGQCLMHGVFSYHSSTLTSELADPERLLPHLLQADITCLPQDTISVYIQTAIKIFGFWTSELAQRWDEDKLATVLCTVKSIQERMDVFATSPHIEVQERVSGQTFTSMIELLIGAGCKYSSTV